MGDALHAILGPQPGITLAAAGLQANLAAAAGILIVAAARRPVRRLYGPEAAYQLWRIPPAATLVGTVLFFVSLPKGFTVEPSLEALAGPALLVWALGALATASVFALAQARFQAELKAGRAGPAVVGFISPRIVMPTREDGYSADELELIRAHERTHVARKDPRTIALLTLAQCLCWFNPMVHVAARLLRLDQELACDAAVMLRRPKSRALYANTLLKTQLAATPLPLGCYWPARGQHPLEVRVGLLAQTRTPGSGPGLGVVHAPHDAIRP